MFSIKKMQGAVAVAMVAGLVLPQVALAKGGSSSNGASHRMAGVSRPVTVQQSFKTASQKVVKGQGTLSNQFIVSKVNSGQFNDKLVKNTLTPVTSKVSDLGKYGSLLTPTNSKVSPVIKATDLGKYGDLKLPADTKVSPIGKATDLGKYGDIIAKGGANKIDPTTPTTPTTPTNPTTPTAPTTPTTPTMPQKGNHGPWILPIPFPLGGYGGGYGGGGYASAPVVQDSAVVPASYAQASGSVDLVLEDVHMVEQATLVAGPAYRVKFRNQGLQACGAFRVGIFASLAGQMSDEAKAAIEVSGLAAGQVAEVTLRLPQSALKMASTSGQPAIFDRLAVMVDVDKVVVETDKNNNVAVVDRVFMENR